MKKNVSEIKVGDRLLRKKDHDSWIEWIEFEVNETYLELINAYPEDYRYMDGRQIIRKKPNDMTVKERLKAPTPKFFKKVGRIASIVAVGAGVLAKAPIGLVGRIAGYVATAATAIAAMSKLPVDEEKEE